MLEDFWTQFWSCGKNQKNKKKSFFFLKYALYPTMLKTLIEGTVRLVISKMSLMK
jgi:hypothetical protein